MTEIGEGTLRIGHHAEDGTFHEFVGLEPLKGKMFIGEQTEKGVPLRFRLANGWSLANVKFMLSGGHFGCAKGCAPPPCDCVRCQNPDVDYWY